MLPLRERENVAVGAATKGGKGLPGPYVVTINLLGPFAIALDHQVAGPWPRPTAKRLCELVFLSHRRRVSRDLAREQLFPSLDAHAGARALSKALSLAGRSLGPRRTRSQSAPSRLGSHLDIADGSGGHRPGSS